MNLTKKQIVTTIFTLAIVFAIPIALYLSRQRQTIQPRALQGKANFLLSTESISSSVGKDINVLVSLQLTDPSLKVSGVDFLLLYDKEKLDVGNIVPNTTTTNPSAPFTDAPIVSSGGNFPDEGGQYNFIRVTEIARRPDANLPSGTVQLARITFRGRGNGGQATIKFPDDNKYLEISGTGTSVGPTVTPGGPSVTPGGPTVTSVPNPAGLFSFWHMNETSGTTATDSVGNNNGTATGTTIVDGKAEKARSFNTNGDDITVGFNNFATNTFTIAAWFKTNVTHEIDAESTAGVGGVSGEKYLFWPNHGGDANAGMGVSVGTNGISVYEHGSNYMPALAVYNGAVPANTWNHLVVVYENKKPKIYLNGVLVKEGLTSTRGTITMPTHFGGSTYGYFNGQLDEVQYYNRALSAAEIQTLYNNVPVSGPSATTAPTIPVQNLSTPTSIPPSPTRTPVCHQECTPSQYFYKTCYCGTYRSDTIFCNDPCEPDPAESGSSCHTSDCFRGQDCRTVCQ